MLQCGSIGAVITPRVGCCWLMICDTKNKFLFDRHVTQWFVIINHKFVDFFCPIEQVCNTEDYKMTLMLISGNYILIVN